jgi:hypothetical protein
MTLAYKSSRVNKPRDMRWKGHTVYSTNEGDEKRLRLIIGKLKERTVWAIDDMERRIDNIRILNKYNIKLNIGLIWLSMGSGPIALL